MASILVKDLLYRVSSQLNDISPQFTRWTERELVMYLNDAQKVIAKYMPHSCSRVDSIKLVAGTKQSIDSIPAASVMTDGVVSSVPVYGSAVLGVMRNMGANGSTPGKAIRIVDREVLDTNNPDWHTTAGSPPSQYTSDPRTPKIFYVCPPIASASLQWVEVSYLANPTEIAVPAIGATTYGMAGSSSLAISVDDKYIDDLTSYVLARCYLKDATFGGNSGLATAHSTMFVNSINAQVAALTGVNPNLSSLPLNPNIAAAAK